MQKKIIILISILFITLQLRLFSISTYPVSLYWDEVASTYNAYSILKTGKDEYGNSFPVLFKSFNDFKMSGNIYLTSLMIPVCGLNEFSARASSAFTGIIAIFFTYQLVNELLLLSSVKFKGLSKLPVLTAFFLAISPWHIQFSRTGFEANVAAGFVIGSVWLFLNGIRQKKFMVLFLSLILCAASFYVYRSIHVFMPLLIIGLVIIFNQNIRRQKKNFIILLVCLILFLLPLIPKMFGEGAIRAKQVSVVNNASTEVYSSALELVKHPNLVQKIMNNRRVVYGKLMATGYLSHFSPFYLFFSGDANGRHGPRGMGLLYGWEIPFILIGILAVFFLGKYVWQSILIWTLLAPIPAALSVPVPHALRSLNMLPIPQLFCALGVILCISIFLRPVIKKLFSVMFVVIVVAFFFHYLNLYYYKTAFETSADWADGYQQLMAYVIPKEKNYQHIIISGHYWQPYIYALFYKKYDPAMYQKNGKKSAFDKYIFGGTSWDFEGKELGDMDLSSYQGKKTLIAVSPEEYNKLKPSITAIHTIYNHLQQPVFIVGDL